MKKTKLEKYIEYYDNIHLHYLIALPCRNREFSVLASSYESRKNKNIRNLRCERPQDFQFFWRALHIINDKYYMNFYHSIARYKNGLPVVPLNKHHDMKSWNLRCKYDIIDYEFLLDIDADSHKDINKAHDVVRRILIDLLEKKCNGIFIMLSGMGFHILVQRRFITHNTEFDDTKDNNIYDEYRSIAKHYHKTISTMVDTRIYDHRRLMKCPYSLGVYDDTMIVAHPFCSIEEFLNFALDDYRVENYSINRSIKYTLPLISWHTEKDRLQLLQKLNKN